MTTAIAGKILSWDFNPLRYVCKYRYRNESWQEGIKKTYPQNVGQEHVTKPH